jgi:hypothetical protein
MEESRGGKISTLNNIETMARSSRKIKQILEAVSDHLYPIEMPLRALLRAVRGLSAEESF